MPVNESMHHDAPRTDLAARPVDDAVLTRVERATLIVLWILFSGLPSLTLWALTGYFGFFYSPLVWLVVLGATTPTMARTIGWVEPFDALPPAPRALSHLPAPLVRMVEEAAAIRDELAAHGLEPALERAWVLCCDLERHAPIARIDLEPGREALADVRALIDTRARPGRTRLSPRQQRARLHDALVRFETALAQPRDLGFR